MLDCLCWVPGVRSPACVLLFAAGWGRWVLGPWRGGGRVAVLAETTRKFVGNRPITSNSFSGGEAESVADHILGQLVASMSDHVCAALTDTDSAPPTTSRWALRYIRTVHIVNLSRSPLVAIKNRLRTGASPRARAYAHIHNPKSEFDGLIVLEERPPLGDSKNEQCDVHHHPFRRRRFRLVVVMAVEVKRSADLIAGDLPKFHLLLDICREACLAAVAADTSNIPITVASYQYHGAPWEAAPSLPRQSAAPLSAAFHAEIEFKANSGEFSHATHMLDFSFLPLPPPSWCSALGAAAAIGIDAVSLPASLSNSEAETSTMPLTPRLVGTGARESRSMGLNPALYLTRRGTCVNLVRLNC
jgi:hypothetical protein